MSAAPSMLTAWVTLGGETLPCKLDVTLDETWSPFVQGSFVIPYTPERKAAADPRSRGRVRLLARRQWYDAAMVRDLWSGLTLAQVGTHAGGTRLDALGAALSTAWSAADPWRVPDELAADLAIRRRSIDYAADTITVTVASDEILTQGARVTLTRPSEQFVDRIVGLLTAAGLAVVRSDMAAGAAFIGYLDPDTVDLKTDIWTEVNSLATSHTLRLVCDHTRTWRLVDPTAAPTVTLALPRVSSATDTIDLDGEYTDALVNVVTAWIQNPAYPTTSSDPAILTTGTKTWPYPLPDGPCKVTRIETDLAEVTKNGPWPAGFGDLFLSDAELAARLRRAQLSDRALTLTAPADPTARPGMALTTGTPSLPATTSIIAAVTFRIPEDTMTITTRTTSDVAA